MNRKVSVWRCGPTLSVSAFSSRNLRTAEILLVTVMLPVKATFSWPGWVTRSAYPVLPCHR